MNPTPRPRECNRPNRPTQPERIPDPLPPPMTSMIQLRNVSKSYGAGPDATHVLKDVNLDVKDGEFVAVVGRSGSGKTTLISLMAGLIHPDQGEVLFQGRPVTGPDPRRALMFQNYSLLPWLTVEQNVALAVDAVFPRWTAERRRERTLGHVKLVGLERALGKRPAELSGGMRQRVSLARALAMDPELLLLDEPLGALDALTRGRLQDEIARIWSENRKTVALITNDVDEGILLADRVIPMTLGPGATLGPAFEIDLPRPRRRKELNHDPRFRSIRARVIEYLSGQARQAGGATVRRTFVLPQLRPEDLSTPRSFRFGARRPVRSDEIKHEPVEVDV